MTHSVARTLAVVVGALSASVALVAQGSGARPDATKIEGVENVKTFVASRVRKGWTAPKTPWGDPDIAGIFTTKDEANTPLERPAEWAGRKMDDITSSEFEEAVAKRQQLALEAAPFAGGGEPEEGVAIAVPIHWFDNLNAKNSRAWFVIDPIDGKVPEMTPEGKRLAKESIERRAVPEGAAKTRGGRRDSYTDRNLGDRCIGFGPWRQPGIYGNSFQIIQGKDHVVLRQEQIHEARIVPLDGRGPLSAAIRNYLGDARGHWEGNTLVVVTTNFNPKMDIRNLGPIGGAFIPAGNLRLIERFTRIAPGRVEWTMTFDDPTIWSHPWTYSLPMTEDDKQIIHEYACHEGNFGMANLLSAGRKADQGLAPK